MKFKKRRSRRTMKTKVRTSIYERAYRRFPLRISHRSDLEQLRWLHRRLERIPFQLMRKWSRMADVNVPEFLWPCNISWAIPVAGSQNCTPRSFEPLSTQLLSGVSVTLRTKSCYRENKLSATRNDGAIASFFSPVGLTTALIIA